MAGASIFPSSRKGAAAMAPSLRVRRVVPPAPGKMPIRISGRPMRAFGLSAAKMRWQASGSSSPMPAAVPGSAAAMGLPPFSVLGSIPARSILRNRPCSRITPSKSPRAGSSPAISRMRPSALRSMPPAKLPSLPEVMTTPFTVLSERARSISPSSSAMPSKVSTFMLLPGTSQIMVATPSASTA